MKGLCGAAARWCMDILPVEAPRHLSNPWLFYEGAE
jgi:hypothetical protein